MLSRREQSTCRVEARDKKTEQRKEKSTAPQQHKQHPKSQRWVNHEVKRLKAPSSCCRSPVGKSFCLWPVSGIALTVSLWETGTRAMAIDLLQASTPVPALHDALSSAHAVLRLWQLPGPAQPTCRAALLAAGARLPPALAWILSTCTAQHPQLSLHCPKKSWGRASRGFIQSLRKRANSALLQRLSQAISWLWWYLGIRALTLTAGRRPIILA